MRLILYLLLLSSASCNGVPSSVDERVEREISTEESLLRWIQGQLDIEALQSKLPEDITAIVEPHKVTFSFTNQTYHKLFESIATHYSCKISGSFRLCRSEHADFKFNQIEYRTYPWGRSEVVFTFQNTSN